MLGSPSSVGRQVASAFYKKALQKWGAKGVPKTFWNGKTVLVHLFLKGGDLLRVSVREFKSPP